MVNGCNVYMLLNNTGSFMINFSCIPYLYNNYIYIYNYYIGWGYIVLFQEKLITSGACGNWFYATSIKLNMI